MSRQRYDATTSYGFCYIQKKTNNVRALYVKTVLSQLILYRDKSAICWPRNIVSVVTLSRVPSSLDLTLIITVGTKYGSQNFTCQLQIVFLCSFFVWHFFMFVCISVVHIMHKWPTWLHSHGRDSGYCMRVMMTLALP